MNTKHTSAWGPVLVSALAAAIGVWATWFMTHVPWVGLSEQVSTPIVLVVWLALLAWGLSRWMGRGCSTWNAALTGLVSAAVGLLLLGTKLAQPPTAAGVSPGLIPSAPMVALGFLLLGVVLGVIAGFVARLVPRGTADASPQGWLFRFGVVTCCAVAPLLFVGGLVTSTNSGMAVLDWPNTFSSNMFLYPLGPRAEPGVFFEHSHRLFGTLVGLCALVLTVLVWMFEVRKWVCWLVTIGFILVVAQGALGGLRVLLGSTDVERDRRIYALLHGVLAQLVFGVLVAATAVLSPAFRDCTSTPISSGATRRVKLFASALMHSLILQLLLGAAYRHFRHMHILWTHIALALVVAVVGIIAGLVIAQAGDDDRRTPLRSLGTWLLVVVALQFCLGWLAFLVGGRSLQAEDALQAIVRTVHQANGGLLLAIATAGFVWARKLARVSAAPGQKIA